MQIARVGKCTMSRIVSASNRKANQARHMVLLVDGDPYQMAAASTLLDKGGEFIMKRVILMLILMGMLLAGDFALQNRQPMTLRVLFWRFGGISTRDLVFASMLLGAFMGGSAIWMVLRWRSHRASHALRRRLGPAHGDTLSQTPK